MQIEPLYANDIQIQPESLSLAPWSQEMTCLCAVEQKVAAGVEGELERGKGKKGLRAQADTPGLK